jgi:hypothetical protein
MGKTLFSCNEYMVKPNVIINCAFVTQVTVFWGAGIIREIHDILPNLYLTPPDIFCATRRKF